jgi:protocatechuate 3,4-dioxygenase alpha subunit
VTRLTPSQTLGPFFHQALEFAHSHELVSPTALAPRIRIEGALCDGLGAPVSDALLEIWQADAQGRYHHPDDLDEPSRELSHHGFGRVQTGADGRFAFETLKPGSAPGPGGTPQAPHLLLGLFARGLLDRLVTRIYFADDPAHATDPILALVPPARRATLLARPLAPGRYGFDITLQGERETVFFDV